MIVLISNKLPDLDQDDDRLFAEEMNGQIGERITLATAQYTPRQEKAANRWAGARMKEFARSILFSAHEWRLTPVVDGEEEAFFDGLIKRMKEGGLGARWLFMIHGAGQPTVGALEQAARLKALHGVNVILFLWPSWSRVLSLTVLAKMAPMLIRRAGLTWPKAALALGYGLYEEKMKQYQQAREKAKTCRTALDAALRMVEKDFTVKAAMVEGFSISMMAHSLGALVVESMTRDPALTGPGRIFDNVILNAADVDSEGHAQWASALNIGQRLYVIQNRYDAALQASRTLAGNPRRLGARLKGELAENVTAYIDLSPGKGSAARHAFFMMDEKQNREIKNLYTALFTGVAMFERAREPFALPGGFRLLEGNHFAMNPPEKEKAFKVNKEGQTPD
ncbi:MAG: alpha/beta hydrolase [Nitrospinota bacterium]|nr:alpha/beta hydrolase [Nitrospinota bacterium]